MGVDKGHCTEGIRTGSLSNSLLEKEKPVKRGIQRQRGREGEIACEGRSPDRTTFHFTFFPLFILHHVIFPLLLNYNIGLGRGAGHSH